jgi:hypothetical protein
VGRCRREQQRADALAPYSSVIEDTVGRCLDLITADIAATDPKKAPGGNLSQQGWGVLKNRFRQHIATLRALGKDVLLIAHDKEDKDGDTRIVRPDIVGGSFGEVMKVADFVGYCYMSGRDRVLDFNPTDRWIGKNPAGMGAVQGAAGRQGDRVHGRPLREGPRRARRDQRGQREGHVGVDDWRTAIDAYTTLEEVNRALPEMAKLTPIVAPQVKKLLMAKAKALGFVWNPGTVCFGGACAGSGRRGGVMRISTTTLESFRLFMQPIRSG